MDVIRKTNLSRYKSHSFITWLNTYCSSEIRDIFKLKDSSYVPGPLQYLGNSDGKITPPYILRCNTEDGFIEASANLLLYKITEKLNESHDSIALIGFSGGITPLKIFERLAELQDLTIDTSRLYIFIVDERYTKNASDSNCEMVRRTLISIWQIPESNVIFPDLNLPIDECIADYQLRLGKILQITTPYFVTLGLGNDGHIGGLFPEYIQNFTTQQLISDTQLVIKTETSQFTCNQRLTVTLPVLMSAKTKIFFIKGEKKYECWKEMIDTGLSIVRYPATYLFTKPGCICVFDSSGCKLQSVYSNYSDDDFLSVVIFGSNGDLSRRRLFPALFHLFYCGLLPSNFKIICATRSRISFDDYFFIISNDIFSSILTNIYMCNPAIRFDFPTSIDAFKQHCSIVKLVYDGTHVKKLQDKLEEFEKGYKAKRLFYLATPSSAYKSILDLINKVHPNSTNSNRVMLEKPFGTGLSSCIELTGMIKQMGNVKDNFIVDHYIGKAVLKFILSVRTSNNYKYLFSNEYVNNIHIELLEEACAGNRPYFENYGIIRDMLQNHAMILLSYITMSLNSVYDNSSTGNESFVEVNNVNDKFHFNHAFPFHQKRLELLKAVETISLDNVVVGQYVSDGYMPGFKDTLLDQKNSKCPTFSTIKLSINNPQWLGVPIVITAGKALRERIGRITMTFKSSDKLQANMLNIGKLIFMVHPKPMAYWVDFSNVNEQSASPVDNDYMDQDLEFFSQSINQIPLPGVAYEDLMKPIAGAYENVLLNALWGYRHLFPTIEEVIECWRIYDQVLTQLDVNGVSPYEYVRGSDGPKEKELIHGCLK
ncbi:6-phosphogluconolactonase [Babesia microti strain RI]|uniref:glucose-6-phosphate dehydrogenase (NADP(+)) n=1 Tax=Babesia microti (strain RI) TaxID=1133968 RepID=A0A1N6LWP3_BABMR|nr:6-phosphogluconolactonase [Babesia microti strain RI]SIO73288.1 6-phosphogluconolactonase [Babesia microti strain RI]|eukprot:XP_021337392.1 6-phosphogluconolactonase [Babesia microti strain RI]